MEKELDFSTKEKKNSAIADFTSLMAHPGWKRFEAIQKANIGVLEKQILEGVENETKEIIDTRRLNLKLHKEVLSTPKIMIDRLNDPITIPENFDPYPTVADLEDKEVS